MYVHWVGWSTRYNQWIPKEDVAPDVVETPEASSTDNIADNAESFYVNLRNLIEKKLPGSVRDSSEVRIRDPCEKDILQDFLKLKHSKERGTLTFDNKELDSLLGRNWNIRILNESLKEHIITEGQTKLITTEQGYGLSFRFVKMTGTVNKLERMLQE